MDSNIKKIGLDKITHFAISFMLVAIIHKLMLFVPNFEAENIYFSAITALAIGFTKEFYDGWNGKFSIKDLFADFLGVVFYVLLYLI